MKNSKDIFSATTGRISRRHFVGAVGAGVTATMATGLLPQKSFAETPKSGGRLRIGIAGGSTSDSLDPRTFTDTVCEVAGYTLMNSLVEIAPDNTLVPELAESWEAKPGASEWIFNIRKGVTFHNGKTLTAEDAVYSINLHRGTTKSGAAGLLKSIADIKAISPTQMQVTLKSADADFPYILTDYHLLIVPKDFNDWSQPVGTGAFTLEAWDPGVRFVAKRQGSYWKADRGYLDEVEMTVINDVNARMTALLSKQVDIVNRVSTKTVGLLKNAPNIEIVQSPSSYHGLMPMLCDQAPFDNADLRMALKYAVDREMVLKTVFQGYGSVGNDNPIARGDPFFNSELPQTVYDPDKSRFHLKKAGMEGTAITLAASDAAFSGAVDVAVVFQESATKAGIKLNVDRKPADGYWDNVWMKVPFCMSNWAGRPAATQMMGIAYKSDAPWNESHWRNPQFDQLLADARSELDTAKRKEYIWAMQKMLHDDGGVVIPVFMDRIGASASKVRGHTPHLLYELDNSRIAEKAWIAD